ncbi:MULTISPECIES: hypothetical protein [Stigmatella]|uniref:Uncharacterized protein n=2 Tax=Stigmatella TaxID=40 RepID=A0A1H7K6I2_STIAU|nr:MULTISPECIES: hypothetical protein [Stigmatella]SEK81547.1 hypothetical protein SAMN05444354_102422 [Stigmatella aurantiaca]SES89749.1 hypothetical protein SAMN05443639_101571 [Stigmatella erecta]
MRSPARRQSADAEIHARLSARIEALEDRVRQLELHVRRAASAAVRARSGKATASPREVSGKPRPRCPGCTLELPRGRRGESCVWCGFHFAAVRRRAGKG